VRRHALGILALASLIWGAIFWFYPPLEPYKAAAGPGLRMGLLLIVFWLAWPDLDRLPRWAWYVMPFALLGLVYAKNILIYLGPVLAAALAAYVLYRKIWRARR
jgi:hypothetical protein